MHRIAFRLSFVLLVSLLGVRAVSGEVKSSAPGGLLITHVVSVGAAPVVVWDALPKVGQWWNKDHSWSGAAANLSLDPQAGGCFCERWAGGSVEHGHVVMAMPPQTLRMTSALGPLQEMALSGVLTFTLARAGEGTTLTLTYRVSGDASHGLDKIGSAVDAVLGEQVARLKRFVETGSPQ